MAIEYRFQLLVATDRPKHFWTRIRSKNGKIVWTSEVYTSKAKALTPVKKIVRRIGVQFCDISEVKVKTKEVKR